jgi:Protein of unknown function (DUF1573)/HYDIN/CFA65/VesB-like, Ig-like domain
MKQMLITAALLLAMTLPAVAAAPDLVIENYKFDFGQVYQGERVEHVYRFRNAGDVPLRIEKVRSSCGCTAALASADIIAPGEQGEVKAVFDSTRFRGRVSKTIYLYTDDPVHRETHFTLSGEVLAKLVANPAKLVFDNLSPGVERKATITVTNQGQESLQLEAAKTSIAELTATLEGRTLAPGETTRLLITVLPKEGTTRFSGYVFVRGTGTRAPELRIPIQAAFR